jgi:hypothetical protein
MRKAFLLAAAATATLAGSVQAQICAGYPSPERSFYFGARADFPEDLDSYGAEANYNLSGPLGVYAGLNIVSAEDDEGDDDALDEYYGGAALEFSSLRLMAGPQASGCVVGEVRFIGEDGDSYTEIPVGLGIGATLGVPGVPVSGYVQPQVVFSIIDTEILGSESETNFAIKAGANVGFGLVTVGGEVRHMFLEADEDFSGLYRDETTFGIRVGFRIGPRQQIVPATTAGVSGAFSRL